MGVEDLDRELLDAKALVGHLVPEGSMLWFLADHRRDLFADEEFEDLFGSGKGWPSIPESVMASILVLQTLHDFSDRETAEAARCDLRWKVATEMALDVAGFDAPTLVYWRRRLARSERPHRIKDAVTQVIEQTGILRGRGKPAVDSTILADAVATQDRHHPADLGDGGFAGRCPTRLSRSRRCAPAMTTLSRLFRGVAPTGGMADIQSVLSGRDVTEPSRSPHRLVRGRDVKES